MGLTDDLSRTLGTERVLTRALDRHARAHDASHYLLVPEVVAVAEDAGDVARTMTTARAHATPVTFRSGGTSLSGQAAGAGVLVDTRRGFRRVEVLDDGRRVRVQPGATLRTVNARLAPFGRALGPDPASEAACTIGGVIANNSSGMAAGTEHNSYRTLESMVVVLASGTVLDTGAPGATDRLRAEEPALCAELETLRDRVRSDPVVAEEIRRRFAMKNTMGYALDAFCDYSDPVDLLAHLLVGSEGTLGFVAEAVFRTVQVQGAAATGLLVFESVDDATRALPALVGTGAAALEFMDSTSLRVARRSPGAPESVTGFPVDEHAAILVEYRADDADLLAETVGAAEGVLDGLPTVLPLRLTRDDAERSALWKVRKGLYATVAGARPPGTTALLEDIVVPVAELADTCRELRDLLAVHGYVDPVVFGHAKDGNLHFMLTQDTEDPAAVSRLAAFTDDLVELVLRHGGNLKAEHGTGRAMAPFVERQYSPALVDVLWRVKRAFDPAGILNPGVVLTTDRRAHLTDLKPVEPVDAEVDRCVECGYCEPVCPSRDLTLTPRQRIVARRARARAEARGDGALVAELDEQFGYDGVDTCAADGMCATSCPVQIDTGALVKRLRQEQRGRSEQRAWSAAASHWGAATTVARATLSTAARLPAPFVQVPNRAARAVAGADDVPWWTPDLPAGGRPRSRTDGGRGLPGEPAAIFLPSCQGAMFAPATASGGVQTALAVLCRAAGVGLVPLDDVDALCCGTPWSSKGFDDGHRVMAERVLDAVDRARRAARRWTGRDLPVVVDATSCTEGVAGVMATARASGDPRAARVVDAVTFAVEHVLPRLDIDDDRRVDSVTVHPTCSSTRAGLDGDLRVLASAVARDVHVPVDWGCCGFAGDRGMLHPELTAAATAAEAAEVSRLAGAEHASCNRACEIGMSRATGRSYRHLLEIAADVVESSVSLDGPAVEVE
ncbi:FAD-binding and (Fe-S)-binding domain-containing protein [Isoptericola sp. AK164]|uniref:FAD-binding and (Fe-S)-binding domain-containing protein n=1 Tax=Isoptericola sp. AK164 TaxID=3024246 RepID=UPI0024189AA3|nr:FAD-binding and (Fe-S)-binding domain-containing protein [Isoptericola sp. AK164]